MKHTDSQTRLKSLLRGLFQLDVADLDFGLYRLFRLKRDEVEAFLNRQLPAEVEWAFAAVAGAEREALQKRVDDLAFEEQWMNGCAVPGFASLDGLFKRCMEDGRS